MDSCNHAWFFSSATRATERIMRMHQLANFGFQNCRNIFHTPNLPALTPLLQSKLQAPWDHAPTTFLRPTCKRNRFANDKKLDDGWPESEKDVFQAALRMVVVKDGRWMVGEFYMSYGGIRCEKVRVIKKRILGKRHQMTRVLQPQTERGRREREKERGVERKHGEI